MVGQVAQRLERQNIIAPRSASAIAHIDSLKSLLLGGATVFLIAPMVIGLLTLEARGEVSTFLVAYEVFTGARLGTLAAMGLRATMVAVAALAIGTPIGIWIATLSSRRVAYAALMALVLPFFINDSLKAYYWAEALSALSSACNNSASLGRGGTWLGALLSPYGTIAPYIPLVLGSIPIASSVVAVGYSMTVSSRIAFFEEISARRDWIFRQVTIPLLSPYIALAGLLSAGLVFPSSAEQQYLGGGISNNLRTLMESLVRSGVAATQLFVLAATLTTIALATGVGAIASLGGSAVLQRGAFLISRGLSLSMRDQRAASPGSTTKARDRKPCWRRPLTTAWSFLGLLIITASWMPLAIGLWEGLVVCGADDCRLSTSTIEMALAATRSQSAMIVSVELGCLGAVGGLVFGFAGLWLGLFERVGVATVVVLLVYLLMPGDSVGIGLGQLARLAGLDEGSVPLAALGQATVIFPYCLSLGVAGGFALPRGAILSLEEYGRGMSMALVGIVTRLAAATLISAALFGWVLSLNETVRTSYLSGTAEGVAQLAIAYQNAGRISGPSDAAGLTAVLLVFGIAALSLTGALGYRSTVQGSASLGVTESKAKPTFERTLPS